MTWNRLSAEERSSYTLPACLIIMDGFGLTEDGPGNAITNAKTPHLSKIFSENPTTKLEASGKAVGLPDGQMGNSEVGHLNIGAGRIVFQELTRINNACEDGSIAHNEVLKEAFKGVRENNSYLHFMGLMSDGGVHSSNAHLFTMIKAAKEAGVQHVFVHCFMDGRDVPPRSGKGYIEELEEVLRSVSDDSFTAEIASIEGRYYAMDRDNRWDRVNRAFDAIVSAKPLVNDQAANVMQSSYDADITDEFVEPVALRDRGVLDGDAVVFFNFRPDRAREITRAFVDDDFTGFERSVHPKVQFVCLTEYDPTINAPIAFAKEFPTNVLADVLAKSNLAQFHIAETEKYAHVTFFLNGGKEASKEGEERCLVPSPKVATYDLKPEMSAIEVTDKLVEAIDNDAADVYIVNFANCDMVGHTGIIPAAIKAVETVDASVSRVLEALERKNGFALLTADHGNADRMLDNGDVPYTAHTTAPVPFTLVDYTGKGFGLKNKTGALCDIAPTLLSGIGIDQPKEMTGESFLIHE